MKTHGASAACVLVVSMLLAGCYSGAETTDGEQSDNGLSSTAESLTVGGHYCPTHGEIAGRNIPSDERYYLTSFGGGSDSGRMACGTYADGRWLYMADSWRFGCGAHVRIENPHTGRYCVVSVQDVGPNICVERAAHKPVIDASPLVSEHLFHRSGAGWSDHLLVRAVRVHRSTPLGCH